MPVAGFSVFLTSSRKGGKKMAQAKRGDIVKVHYIGTFNDGSEFDSSYNREPLQFTIGDGLLIPAFEEAVEGMKPGERKKLTIPAEQAYGPYINELAIEFDKSQFPKDIDPEVGSQLQIEQEDGGVTVVKVIRVTDSKVVLDANHPLAGKDLNFNIELVEIVP